MTSRFWEIICEMFLYIKKKNFNVIPKEPFPTEAPIAEYWFIESLFFFLISCNIYNKSCTVGLGFFY